MTLESWRTFSFHLQALPMAYTLETVQENYHTHQGLGLGNNVHFELTEEVIP